MTRNRQRIGMICTLLQMSPQEEACRNGNGCALPQWVTIFW